MNLDEESNLYIQDEGGREFIKLGKTYLRTYLATSSKGWKYRYVGAEYFWYKAQHHTSIPLPSDILAKLVQYRLEGRILEGY